MDKGEDRKEEEPTDIATISVIQLVKENIHLSFDVHGRRTNKRLLLRLVHS
jgi:hypothetical protein